MTKFVTFQVEDLEALKHIVGEENVSTEESELLIHSTDAFPGKWIKPDVVVWPEKSEEISKIVQYANQRKLPVTPRGAGSSLSGNAIPAYHGIVLNFRRMNKIVEIRERDLQVVVEPGVVYDQLNLTLQPFNLFFPPDPGSSSVCTIGGMVANNASGLGAVKYGVTRDYVLGLEVVLPNGKMIRTGSNAIKSSTGYDLLSLFIGSEGTLGVVTRITLRLRTLPHARKTAAAYFDSVSSATDGVSEIIQTGLTPAAMEFLDRETIVNVNRSENLGLRDSAAMLIAEYHGTDESATSELKLATEIFRKHGAVEIHEAKDDGERKKLWTGRKGAYPSLVRSAPSVIIGDIVVPISKITEMLQKVYEIGTKYEVKIACFGHCGDGNIHPNIMTDRKNKESWERALKASEEIVTHAIKLGGVASGEHGIGLEKKQFMQLEHGDSLELMRAIKAMLDRNDIMNPGKFVDV